MKFTLLVNVPLGVVTVTGPVIAPTGTVAVINLLEITLKEEAGTPLKLTTVEPVRPAPRIWTTETDLALGDDEFHERAQAHIEAEQRAAADC